jgi:hypothetical protein
MRVMYSFVLRDWGLLEVCEQADDSACQRENPELLEVQLRDLQASGIGTSKAKP